MHDAFIAITVLTLGASALVWLLQRLRMSPIIGYILLGVLAGPFKSWLFGAESETAETMTELAIILLMFFIGLEFHLEELRANLRLLLLGGTLQVLFTATIAAALCRTLDIGYAAAVIIGLMVAFSSTALVFKAFEDRRESDSQRSRVALVVLVFQDLAAILIVSILPLFSTASPGSGTSLLDAVFRLSALFVLLPLLFAGTRKLLPIVFSSAAVARTPELFSLLSLGICLSVALAAQFAGASLALGAFLGGLVLCQTPFASQIIADLSTLRNLSLAFFFVSVGMLVDLGFVTAHALQLLGALVALLILKTIATLISLRLAGTMLAVSAGVALALAQIGEFSFVLGREAVARKLLPPAEFQFVLALALLSMLATPFLVQFSGVFGQYCASLNKSERADKPAGPTLGEPTAVRAIVVGYGPVGRTLTRIMKDFGIEPVIIDMNIETVKKLTQADFFAIYGDAGRREILRAAGVEHAAFLLVTLPDLPGRIPVVATARMLNPTIKILTRARYLAEQAMLEEAGATAIAYEESEVAVSLARFLLREIGASEADVQREAQRIRAEIAVRSGFSVVMPSPVQRPKQ
ncbi:MAG TPA: cation:proton antiporter [Planctomycetota bacterium]|nr:cation:proton antiporter [Planctomycetota bacterium]